VSLVNDDKTNVESGELVDLISNTFHSDDH
jgi:hypothetical protein